MILLGGCAVAVGVIRLPAPCIGAHFVDTKLGLPAQKFFSIGWICIKNSNVTLPPRSGLVFELPTASLGHSSQHVENRIALAGSEVDRDTSRICFYFLEGCDMTLCEIDDMDVIANASAIVSSIIHAEDGKIFAPADSDLSDVGHEIVGDACGVLTDTTRGVSATWIEIAENHNVPFWIGFVQVSEKFLNEQLGAAVRIGGTDFDLLSDGHLLDQAVDGSGGGEDKVFTPILGEQVEEMECASEIVVVVTDGLLDTFADGFEACKMDTGVEGEFMKD